MKKLSAVTAGMLLWFGVGSTCYAIDVDAGDLTAAPAGTNLAMVYYQVATRESAYVNGVRQPIEPKLISHIGMLRVARFVEVGGFTVAPQAILPFWSPAGRA